MQKYSDNIVTTNALYGGSHNQFTHYFSRFGIQFRFVVGDDPADYERAIDERTRGLYCESIGKLILYLSSFRCRHLTFLPPLPR